MPDSPALQPDRSLAPAPADAAQQSLAEALKVSFTILKLAMAALLVAYAASGAPIWLPPSRSRRS